MAEFLNEDPKVTLIDDWEKIIVEDSQLIDELNNFVKPYNDIILTIPNDWSNQMKDYILTDVQREWHVLDSKNKNDSLVGYSSNGHMEIQSWENIDRMMKCIFTDIALSGTRGQDFHYKEDCLRDIMFELLLVGWPYKSLVYESDRNIMFVKGPFIYPNKRMKIHSSSACINLMVGKAGKWIFFQEFGEEFYDYISKQTLLIDLKTMNLLDLHIGDTVELRLILDDPRQQYQYYRDDDSKIYELRDLNMIIDIGESIDWAKEGKNEK